MGVRVGSARSNENGGVNGGKAGDQTGREVSTQPWYLHSKGWIVIRAKSPAVREAIAKNMEAACQNNNIGYCQGHRGTATAAAKPYDYDLSKVNAAVETDCSELVRCCVLYAGIHVNGFSTANEVTELEQTGQFYILEENKYCKAADYLLRGDILVTKTKGHTVVVLDNGSKSSQTEVARKKDVSISGTYKTTADLNLRVGAGTTKDILVTIPKGTAVSCYGYYSTYKGKPWYYVKTTVRGVTYTGFCSSAYLKR